MSQNYPIRCVCNLGKKYTFDRRQEQYPTILEAIVNLVKTPFRRFHGNPLDEGLWALKDISFDVERGILVVCIIWWNCKFSLLKILAWITSLINDPVGHHGQVGSPLEVGVGYI